MLAILTAALGAWLGWLAPIAIIVFYLITHSGGHGFHLSGNELVVVVLVTVAGYVGWQRGGRAMLRDVGEREYRNRVEAAKTISSIWRRWFGDAK